MRRSLEDLLPVLAQLLEGILGGRAGPVLQADQLHIVDIAHEAGSRSGNLVALEEAVHSLAVRQHVGIGIELDVEKAPEMAFRGQRTRVREIFKVSFLLLELLRAQKAAACGRGCV